jgi:S-layer protein
MLEIGLLKGPSNRPLTTGVDSPVGGATDDTINGISTTLTTGDIIKGGAGNDTLALTLDGSTGNAEVTGVETVSVRLLSSSTLNQTLMAGVTSVSVGSSSTTATDLTVTGADLATTYEIASGKVNGLTVTYQDATGTADTAKLSLKGNGSATADAAVSVSSGNLVEAVTISTTGKNYVDLTAGTAAKSVTITGDGSNFVDIISSATSTTVDASAATGSLDLDIGSGLTAGDVLKAGAATTDKLTATVASTAVNAPTVSGFETLALTLSAAVNLDLANVTGAKAITLADSAVAQRLSNVAASVTSISSQELSTSANDIRVDYASGANATLALAFSPAALSAAGVTWDDITLSNVADLTISASGAFSSTIDDVAGGSDLENLTIKTSAATADLAVGIVTARSLEAITLTAVAGDITLEDVNNDAFGTVKSLSISASGEAEVTITNALDFYEGTVGTSSLESISIVGGAGSVIVVNDILAAGAATDTGEDVAITIQLGEDSGGSDIDVITVVGVASLDITLAENAGAASEIGLVTAEAGNVGDINVTVEDDGILEFDGVTADEGDIGDVAITTKGDAKVSNIAGGNVDITATSGSIGNVTVVSGNGGTVELDIVATAGDVGNVSLTSNADDVVNVTAAGDIGNITMTVASGDTLATVIDAATTGNISITGAGDGSVEVKSTAATATTGNITVSLSSAAAAVTSTINLSDVGSAGTVSVTGGAGNDTITGAATASTLTGGAGDDTITGGAGADVLSGGDGNDALVGAAGADTITGGAGTDAITGGTGIDTITGGSGVDTITITSAATADRDVITDFVAGAGGDVLNFDLSDLGLAASGTEYAGAVAGLAVDSSDEIVILNAVGYATDEAAEDAVAGVVTTDGLDMVIIYFNTTDNQVRVIHDTDAGVNGVNSTTLIGTISNVATLAGLAEFTLAANISSIA